MQKQLTDYKGWKVMANHHPGRIIFMGYKVNEKGITTDVAEADTKENLHKKIDVMEGEK